VRSRLTRRHQVIFGIVLISFAGQRVLAQPCTLTEVAKLVPDDGDTFDVYGRSLAISDPWFLVGAAGHDEAGEYANSGAVYVYLRQGEQTWTFRQQLFAPDAFGGENFGWSLDTNGAHLVVGAPHDSAPCGGNDCDSGSAYVFYLVDQNTPDPMDDIWLAQAKLEATVPLEDHSFGFNSAIHGDWIIVGAPIDSCLLGSGSAYIYHRDDGGTPNDPTDDAWPLHAELTSPGLAEYADDHFGWDVDIWENRVVVGAPGRCPSREEEFTGLAYAFRRDDPGTPGDVTDDTWVLESTLAPVSPQINQHFGIGVSIRDDLIAVGAYGDSSFDFVAGSVTVFRLNDGGTPVDQSDDSWDFENQLYDDLVGAFAHMGYDVEISGNRIMAGASGHIPGQFGTEGGGFTFRYAGGAWHAEQRLLYSVHDSDNEVCENLDIDGEWVMCGNDRDDTAAVDCGAAYIFRIQNDCNGDCVSDEDELAAGAPDCNNNSVPDDCDLDCNNNSIPDECDLLAGTSPDCNANGVPDECDPDCNGNGIPDDCDLAGGSVPDCNSNGIPDECDIASGYSRDCTGDGVPDECTVVCTDHCECVDADACTYDRCVEGSCVNLPRRYGDADHNNYVTLMDLFSVLDGFAGEFTTCTFEDVDVEPCAGNGAITLADLFAVLDAYRGVDPCCGG